MTDMLYVHNFRGFDNTYIPIKDVNFFVGENSTGKTSILSLLTLLGSPQFWFRQDFNSDRVQLGAFKDIISAQHKETESFFKIGFIVQADNDSVYEAVLMTFEEKNNAPLLAQYNYASKQGKAKIIFTGSQIKYQFAHLDTEPTFKKIAEIFQNWTEETEQNESGFIPLKRDDIFERREALIYIDRLLQKIHGESAKKQDDHLFRVQVPQFSSGITWLAPVRSKPKRTYDEYKLDFDPEGEHTPYLIKSLLKQKKTSREFRQFIENFGKESGLFDSLDIKGYGKAAAAPFELRAVLDNLPLALINVGYGVSQSLPVVVELFARPPKSQFAIQQPEVHLHPKAQAALGDVIFQLANNQQKVFFIETHSDYMIDRFRLSCRKMQGKFHFSSHVLFFDRHQSGNRVQPIEIMDTGEYSENQPAEFRDFFIHEELNLLGL